jgi:hypothetical protein
MGGINEMAIALKKNILEKKKQIDDKTDREIDTWIDSAKADGGQGRRGRPKTAPRGPVQFPLKMTKALHEKVRQVAFDSHKSIHSYIIEAIEEAIKHK